MSRDAFMRMVKDLQLDPSKLAVPAAPGAGPVPTPRTDFDAGRLFERYDTAHAGQITRGEFALMMKDLQSVHGMPAGPSTPSRPAWQQAGSQLPGPTAPSPGWYGAAYSAATQAGAAVPAPAHASAGMPLGSTWPAPPASLASSGFPLSHLAPGVFPYDRAEAAEFDDGRLFEKFAGANAGSLGQQQFRDMVASLRQPLQPGGMPSPSAPPLPAASAAPTAGPWSAMAGATGHPTGPSAFGDGSSVYGMPAMSPAAGLPAPAMAYGPASAPPPRAAPALTAAWDTRLRALSQAQEQLLTKREAAVHQLSRLAARRAEVQAARESIERATMADTEAILHRLRSTEALKLSQLAREAESIAGDVRAIDGFIGALAPHAAARERSAGAAHASMNSSAGARDAVEALARGTGSGSEDSSQAALTFMRAYPALCAEADRLLAVKVPTEVTVTAEDFEREVAARAELAVKYKALQELSDSKTAVIQALLKEREQSVQEASAAANASAAEVQEWVTLADALTGELTKLQRAAAMAGVALPSSSSPESPMHSGAMRGSDAASTLEAASAALAGLSLPGSGVASTAAPSSARGVRATHHVPPLPLHSRTGSARGMQSRGAPHSPAGAADSDDEHSSPRSIAAASQVGAGSDDGEHSAC